MAAAIDSVMRLASSALLAMSVALGVSACGVTRVLPPVGKTKTAGGAKVVCPGGPMPQHPARAWSDPPPMKIVKSHSYTACIETSVGNIVVDLMPKSAPSLVNAVVILANHHFYDGSTFGAISTKTFIAATSRSQPKFSLENRNQGTYFMPTTVFLGHTANGAADVGDIFICTGMGCERLDGTSTSKHSGYSVIGFVDHGSKVVQKIASARHGASANLSEGDAWVPAKPVHIETIQITAGGAPSTFPADNSGS
jgi:cyclophilin family peptidyl-prolyl cis-trans isomerase